MASGDMSVSLGPVKILWSSLYNTGPIKWPTRRAFDDVKVPGIPLELTAELLNKQQPLFRINNLTRPVLFPVYGVPVEDAQCARDGCEVFLKWTSSESKDSNTILLVFEKEEAVAQLCAVIPAFKATDHTHVDRRPRHRRP